MTTPDSSALTISPPTNIAPARETATAAAEAAARAAIEAAYVIAMKRRRNDDNIRVALLAACSRPAFAKVARWERAVGREKDERGRWRDKIGQGLSIRFAEEAFRLMGNIKVESAVLFDDEKRRIFHAGALDLETNAYWGQTITIPKTTERRELRQGQLAIATRKNSYGETVYIVEATSDEVMKEEGALKSKVIRDAILRLVPGDVKEECLERVKKTILDKAAEDPAAEKKQVLDAFAKIGIKPSALEEWLGHPMDAVTPMELVELRGLWAALDEGDITWTTVMSDRRDARVAEAKEKGAATGAADAADATATPGAVAPGPEVKATFAQRKAIEYTAKKKHVDLASILERYKKTDLAQLTNGEAEDAKSFLVGLPEA